MQEENTMLRHQECMRACSTLLPSYSTTALSVCQHCAQLDCTRPGARQQDGPQ